MVRLGQSLDADGVAALAPDVVVLATGTTWTRPPVPGADLPHVRAVDDLGRWLLDGAPLGSDDVVVLGGDLPGLGIAEHAAGEGARVTVLEPTPVFGLHLGLPGRWQRVAELRRRGITLTGGAEVLGITADAVRWRAGDDEHETSAGAVFTTTAAAPDTTLADALAGAGSRCRPSATPSAATPSSSTPCAPRLETAVTL